MKRTILAIALLLSSFALTLQAREFIDPASTAYKQMTRVNGNDLTFEFPQFIFSHTNTVITVKFKDAEHPKLATNNNMLHFIVNGDDQLVHFDKNGVGTISCTFKADNKLSVLFEDATYNKQLSVISIWYILLPLGGLLLFLIYKITFSTPGLSISKKDITERKIKSNLRIVSRQEKEEEVLV